MPSRTILVCLGVAGLALVGTGTLFFLNRDSVSRNLVKAWDTRAERTQATLFRWGELMSIGAELKDRYGAEPDVTYGTSATDRTLGIRFTNYRIPDRVTTEAHAREIAVFAIGKTTKFKQIDAVAVHFQNPPRRGSAEAADGSGPFTFALDELMRSPSHVGTVDPDR